MKNTVLRLLAGVSLAFAGCNGCHRETGGDTPEQDSTVKEAADTLLPAFTGNEPEVSNWSSYHHFGNNDSFSVSETGTDSFYTYTYENNGSYSLYAPLMVYSSDSSKYIDAFSYGMVFDRDKEGHVTARTGEPDEEVAIVDVSTKKRTRIFFCGTACIVEKVAWLNNDIAGIMGISSDGSQTYQPVIWLVNIRTGKTTQYLYNKTTTTEEANEYLKQEFAKKGIDWLD